MKAAVDVRKRQFKICNGQIPNEMCFRTAVFGDKVFGIPPMPLDPVGVCTGVRVHKINLVVNLEVLIALDAKQSYAFQQSLIMVVPGSI